MKAFRFCVRAIARLSDRITGPLTGISACAPLVGAVCVLHQHNRRTDVLACWTVRERDGARTLYILCGRQEIIWEIGHGNRGVYVGPVW